MAYSAQISCELQLGVSRTPIREAIRMLEQQGLVEIRSKNGTCVARFNLEEAQDELYVWSSPKRTDL
ncbi:GntR family transcriptional regulator [Chloroflexi bacterium TSY]|nr:GntR family transcriptional regulator [Chloroflexi bacterium TSY]